MVPGALLVIKIKYVCYDLVSLDEIWFEKTT